MHRTVDMARLLLACLVLAGCTERDPMQADPDRMTAPFTATEIAAEIERAKAVTPLPPGAEWQPIELDPSGSYGAFSGQSMIEFQAFCRWLEAALSARDDDRAEALATARGVIGAAVEWRTFSDPALTPADFRTFIANVAWDAWTDEMVVVEGFVAANCQEP